MPPETQQQQDDNDFTAAFAQFGAAEPAETVAEKPAEPETTETKAETPVAPVAETPEPESTAQAEPEPEPEPESTAPTDDDLLARLAALVKQTPAKKEEPEPEPTAQAEPEPDIYTADEKALLDEYEKDWPDVAKAEALRRRAEYRDLVNHVFREVAKELGPISQTLRTLAERTHLSDLHEKVEDYDDVRDKVVDWVNNQPSYLQNAYKHVIQQGTPDEIADLVARYKNETAPTQPATTTRKTEAELPATTKQAVAALAPVSSKRSTIVQADDPNDFEGAFAAFAKQA